MPSQPTRYCSCRPNCPNRIPKGQRFCADGQGIRDRERYNAGLRVLFGTMRWRRRRQEQLDREPACEDCRREGRLEPATDAHHWKKPRNEFEFFHNALGSLCHRCHSIRTQRGE